MGDEIADKEKGGGLGVAAQNMAAEKPNAAVGTARGMSIRVSRNCLPLNSFRAIIHATGRPATKSITVTIAAISKDTTTALMMRSMVAGSLRTCSCMSDQSVTAEDRMNTVGRMMNDRKKMILNAVQPFLNPRPDMNSSSLSLDPM